MEAKHWLDKLGKFHWSPKIPTSYVFHNKAGDAVGIGTLAAKDYGAFNIVWANNRVIDNPQIHLKCIQEWCLITRHTNVELHGATLGTWLTLLTMEEFMGWLSRNSQKLPKEFRDYAARALLQTPAV